jgi:hypothetical protein
MASEEQVAQFAALAGCEPHVAEQYLAAHDGNLEAALNLYFEHPPDPAPRSPVQQRFDPAAIPQPLGVPSHPIDAFDDEEELNRVLAASMGAGGELGHDEALFPPHPSFTEALMPADHTGAPRVAYPDAIEVGGGAAARCCGAAGGPLATASGMDGDAAPTTTPPRPPPPLAAPRYPVTTRLVERVWPPLPSSARARWRRERLPGQSRKVGAGGARGRGPPMQRTGQPAQRNRTWPACRRLTTARGGAGMMDADDDMLTSPSMRGSGDMLHVAGKWLCAWSTVDRRSAQHAQPAAPDLGGNTGPSCPPTRPRPRPATRRAPIMSHQMPGATHATG